MRFEDFVLNAKLEKTDIFFLHYCNVYQASLNEFVILKLLYKFQMVRICKLCCKFLFCLKILFESTCGEHNV